MAFADHYIGMHANTTRTSTFYDGGYRTRDGVVVDDAEDVRPTSREYVEFAYPTAFRVPGRGRFDIRPVTIAHKCRTCGDRFGCPTARDLHERNHA